MATAAPATDQLPPIMAPLPTHVRRYRRDWALTQRELGVLLGGIGRGSVSRYERLGMMPGFEVLIALEFIFGTHGHDLYPGLALSVIRAVRDNAVSLKDSTLTDSDAASLRKRRLLDDVITRSTSLLSAYD